MTLWRWSTSNSPRLGKIFNWDVQSRLIGSILQIKDGIDEFIHAWWGRVHGRLDYIVHVLRKIQWELIMPTPRPDWSLSFLFRPVGIGIVRLDESHNFEVSLLHSTDALFRFSGRIGQTADHCAEVFTWEISLATDGSLDTFECVSRHTDFSCERFIFRQQVRG